MANNRSSGGSRSRDLFRAEVSSLLADLGQLAEELEAPPSPSPGGPEPGSAAPPTEIASAVQAEQAEPSGGELQAAAEEPAGEAGESLLELEDLPSFSPSYLPPFPPLQRREEASSAAAEAAAAQIAPDAQAAAAMVDNGSAAATTFDSEPDGPPPPALGRGWGGEAEVDEPASLAAAPEPAAEEWEPSRPAPQEWEAQWEAQTAEASPGQAAAESPTQAVAEPGAPPSDEPADGPLAATDPDDGSEAVTQAARGPDGGPGWQVRRPLTMTPLETPAPSAEQIGVAANESAGTPDLGDDPWQVPSSPSPDLAQPAAAGGSTTTAAGIDQAGAAAADPDWGLPPALSAEAASASSWGNGGQRLGVPLLPGGLPPLVSTRPWNLAAAMQPLAPLGPPARPAGASLSEGAGPQPTPPRTAIALHPAVLPAALIALLIIIVILIVLDLHH